MVDKALTILSDLLQPQKDWGCFSRKMISLITLSLIGFLVFDLYLNVREHSDKYIPVSELMETKKDRAAIVRQIMKDLHRSHAAVQGVWLYSWPDAANLNLVHHEGQGFDPIPTGNFHTEDAADVGRLGLDICTRLNRIEDNTACTIFGAGDAWGVLVVVWEPDVAKPDGHISLVDSVANRITYLLYSHSHP